MQDRYVGDVGDFGKYGLLRALCNPVPGDSGSRLKLGVIWYLVPNESHNNDGKHVSYLKPTPQNYLHFRECDPELYDSLQQLVDSGQRNVQVVEKSNILGTGTVFYSRPLTYERLRTSSQRLAFRQEWMSEAMEAVKDCDLVFVDPDNGLECSVPKQGKNGIKYAYYDEIKRLVEGGKSVVIYNHLSRITNADEQVRRRLQALYSILSQPAQIFALRYRRGSARVLFVVSVDKVASNVLSEPVGRLARTWVGHFERLV